MMPDSFIYGFMTNVSENISRLSLWRPSFQFPKIDFGFFRNYFLRTRLKEQFDDKTMTSSRITSIFAEGVEAIELPDTKNEVSFDNPIFAPAIDDSKQ